PRTSESEDQRRDAQADLEGGRSGLCVLEDEFRHRAVHGITGGAHIQDAPDGGHRQETLRGIKRSRYLELSAMDPWRVGENALEDAPRIRDLCHDHSLG